MSCAWSSRKKTLLLCSCPGDDPPLAVVINMSLCCLKMRWWTRMLKSPILSSIGNQSMKQERAPNP